MPVRKPLSERSTASGRPARPRAIVGAILFTLTLGIVVTAPVHIIWSEANVAHAEDELRREGVELAGETVFLHPVKVGKRLEDEMLVTYEYEGESYTLSFSCEDCRHVTETPVWIDPDDPTVYVTEYVSTASKGNVPANAILVLLALPSLVVLGGVVRTWRWWLSLPKVKRKRRRRSDRRAVRR